MKIFIRNKQSILAMSDSRRRILDNASNMSDIIAEHVFKCVTYSKNYKDYNHWLGEITNWILDVQQMTPKKGVKIKPKDYFNALFDGMSDDFSDARRELERFHRKYVERVTPPFPDFNIEYDLYSKIFDAYWELADVVSRKMDKYSKDETTARGEIYKDVSKVLSPYCQSAPWLK